MADFASFRHLFFKQSEQLFAEDSLLAAALGTARCPALSSNSSAERDQLVRLF